MCDFLIDEIDVDSFFFHNFLDVYVVQNRVFRLSKGLFRETYSIKEFVFDPYIAYQSYKLTAELHLTRNEILFILENLKLKKKSYDNISKTFFIPYPTPKFVKTPQENSQFLHFFKDFQSSKSCMIRFGIRFPEISFEKFINFELSSQIYIKIKKLDYQLKNQQFLIDYIQKIQLTWWEDLQRCYFFKFSFFCYLYWQYFSFLQQTIFGHLLLRLLLCIFLLIWKT